MYADGNLTFASSYDAKELIVKLMILIPLTSKNLVPVVTLETVYTGLLHPYICCSIYQPKINWIVFQQVTLLLCVARLPCKSYPITIQSSPSSTRFAVMFQNSSHVFLLVLPLLSYNFAHDLPLQSWVIQLARQKWLFISSYFESSYVIGVSVCIFVALYLCMLGCLLQEPIRLKVLWVDA